MVMVLVLFVDDDAGTLTSPTPPSRSVETPVLSAFAALAVWGAVRVAGRASGHCTVVLSRYSSASTERNGLENATSNALNSSSEPAGRPPLLLLLLAVAVAVALLGVVGAEDGGTVVGGGDDASCAERDSIPARMAKSASMPACVDAKPLPWAEGGGVEEADTIASKTALNAPSCVGSICRLR